MGLSATAARVGARSAVGCNVAVTLFEVTVTSWDGCNIVTRTMVARDIALSRPPRGSNGHTDTGGHVTICYIGLVSRPVGRESPILHIHLPIHSVTFCYNLSDLPDSYGNWDTTV